MWIRPITDRTYADVVYAGAHRDSPEPLKGARNYTDLQRITGNIHHISGLLIGYGYAAPVTCKTVWALGEVTPEAEIAKIRADLDALKAVVSFALISTPALPYTQYERLNQVERILYELHAMLERMAQAWFQSGEVMSGEV